MSSKHVVLEHGGLWKCVRRETSKPSWMHFVEVGKLLCLAQLDLQEASTEACSTSPGSGFFFLWVTGELSTLRQI